MILLGLTGSIGMGKSTAAEDFKRFGIPVHDADATVHGLMAPDGQAFQAIAEAFPGAITGGKINRKRLGDQVFSDPEARRALERILHPLVRQAEHRFLKRAGLQQRTLVVLDIPLLFETGGEYRCDGVVVVTAPHFVQRARVLARPGMSEEKFANILKSQVPDGEKRRRADFVIQTGLGRLESRRTISQIIEIARSWRPAVWPRTGRR